MQLYKFYRQQKNNASRLLCPAIGNLIQQNPHIISEYHGLYEQHKNPLNVKIWQIFSVCEIAFDKSVKDKKIKTISADEAMSLLKEAEMSEQLGFTTEVITKGSKDRVESLLEKGVMLQATAGDVSSIFGRTAGKYWRFHPMLTSDASSLTIYDDIGQVKEALRKLQNPEFQLVKTQPLIQAIENKPERPKSKL